MKQLPLTRGAFALLDDEDFERAAAFKWHFYQVSGRSTQYVIRRPYKGRRILLHRFVLNAPKGVDVDHANGNGLDNRRCNLRLCSMSQNIANSGRRRQNKSGYKGVALQHSDYGSYWRVQITHNYQKLHVGYFPTAQDAARAYDAKALELFGEFARTNAMLGLL